MPKHTVNGIGHFDICGPDMAALQAFYAGVFAWKAVPKGPGYALVETPQGSASGAIVEAEEAALTIGIVVPDIGKAVAAAIACGGSVVMPVMDNGWVKKARLADPAGNVITVIQG